MSPIEVTPIGSIDVSRVKGLLFDIDGTLSDTDNHMVERLSRFLKPFRVLFKNQDPASFARWAVMASESPGNFLYGLADRLYLDNLFAGIYNWHAQRQSNRGLRKKQFLLIPGVKEMLNALHGYYPMAVVSARDVHSTVEFLKAFSLEDFFEVIVTARTCPHTKPFPEPLIYAAERLGVEPESCIMIGDTMVDVRAGKSAGAQTIGVRCGFGSQRDLEKAGADMIVTHTPDILKILL